MLVVITLVVITLVVITLVVNETPNLITLQ
jgi:hypothetical protein